jgi:putative tricarboxylic transport membrane protein
MTPSERKADLITGAVLLVLAAAVIYGGWTMDRLEIRRIHPASIPGLVPLGLGIALAIAAAALVIRAHRALHVRGEEVAPEGNNARLAVTLALCLLYAVGLVGHVPYQIATGLFVFAFIAVFEWEEAGRAGRRIRSLVTALIQAVLVTGVVSIGFEKLFLVRLP